MVKKIKHNDLLPWFLEDHGQLPDAYKKPRNFLTGFKLQATTSGKPQACHN
jgi:hypothetical protein